jgi:hypothetical protein
MRQTSDLRVMGAGCSLCTAMSTDCAAGVCLCCIHADACWAVKGSALRPHVHSLTAQERECHQRCNTEDCAQSGAWLTGLHASRQRSLEAAVTAAAAFLNKAVKPVLVGGVKLRSTHAQKQFKTLADASRYPVAIMPNAKGCAPLPGPGKCTHACSRRGAGKAGKKFHSSHSQEKLVRRLTCEYGRTGGTHELGGHAASPESCAGTAASCPGLRMNASRAC